MQAVALTSKEDTAPSLKLPTEILVVEDDDADYLAIERHLSCDDNEYSLTRVHTLSGALKAIERRRFAAALVDYQLGPDSGIDLIEKFGGKDAPFAIILMTGYEHCDVDERALEAGAADFLQKNAMTRELMRRAVKYAIHNFRTYELLKCAKKSAEEAIAHQEEFISGVKSNLANLELSLAEIASNLKNETSANGGGRLIVVLQQARNEIRTILANCHYVFKAQDLPLHPLKPRTESSPAA